MKKFEGRFYIVRDLGESYQNGIVDTENGNIAPFYGSSEGELSLALECMERMGPRAYLWNNDFFEQTESANI